MGWAGKLSYAVLVGMTMATAGSVGLVVLGKRNGSVGTLRIGRETTQPKHTEPSAQSDSR